MDCNELKNNEYKIPRGINLLKNLEKIELNKFYYDKIKKYINKLKKINNEIKIEFTNRAKIIMNDFY